MVAKRHKITVLWTIQKSLGPLKIIKMSLEMAHKVIVPQKKNYVPPFLKQRYINKYFETVPFSSSPYMAHSSFRCIFLLVF